MLGDESRLADARFAAHQNEAAARHAGIAPPLVEIRKLILAPDESAAHDRADDHPSSRTVSDVPRIRSATIAPGARVLCGKALPSPGLVDRTLLRRIDSPPSRSL